MTTSSSKNSSKKTKANKSQAKKPAAKKSRASSKPKAAARSAAKQKKPVQSAGGSHIGSDAISPQMQQMMQSKILAANLGSAVMVLMQTPIHRDMPLSQVHQLVVPALQHNQINIAEAYNKKSGLTLPVGFVLWARVSDEVDERLTQKPTNPIQLTTEEWSSGENYWIVELIGEKRFVASMLKQLNQNIFKGKPVKYATTSKDGETSIELLKSVTN